MLMEDGSITPQSQGRPAHYSAGVWNTFIEGDNLDVLRGLPAESVDLIYIDPPYNTGNDFAYADDFRAGGRTTRHAAWVAMMRPRLQAARRVLRETGAIFVSIDDNEIAHLRLLMDEEFGEDNLLAQIIVNLNAKGRQLGKGFATSHEYLLAYALDASRCVLDASSTETVVERDFPLRHDDGRRYRHLPLRNTNKKFNPVTARTLHFTVWGDPVTGVVRTAPFKGGVEIGPVFGDGTPAVWRWSRPKIDAQTDDLVCRVVKGKTGDRVDVFQKDWLHRDIPGGRRKKLRTIWLAEEIGSTDTAVAELKEIVGHVFESPKPTGLIARILGTMPADAVVLDFFAGSGTTGHAVALANLTDGGQPTLHLGQLCRADATGIQRRPGGLRDRRRHHPRPVAGRGRPRRWRAGGDHATMTSMTTRVALVTGGSSGIGEASALALREAGLEVYAVARRVDRMAGLEQAGVHAFAMDVTDDASMVAGVERIIRERGQIDVLINNAGYGSYGAVEDVSIDEARRQFEVNLFGLARLTQLVTPYMRGQQSGTIINISSIGAVIYEPFGAWYHATKFAVEGLSDSLRVELRPFGIHVVIVRPAGVVTEWNTISRDSLLETSKGGAYEKYAARAVRALKTVDNRLMSSSAEAIAKTIVKAATAKHPSSRYHAGRGSILLPATRRLVPDRVFDAVVGTAFMGRP